MTLFYDLSYIQIVIDHKEKYCFSAPSFPSIISQALVVTLSSNSSSYYTKATPLLSPLSNPLEDTPSPITDDQVEHDSDNFKQQPNIHKINSPISIHRLTQFASESNIFSSSHPPQSCKRSKQTLTAIKHG